MRYFLLDRVTEIVPGERARGVKNVTLTDETLHDHFPGIPILPGALLVEAMAQLSGFLLEITKNGAEGPIRRAVLAQIQSAKFAAPAQPGDSIDIAVRLGADLDGAARVDAEAFVAGGRIARATLTFLMKEVDLEAVHEQRRALYRIWTRGHDFGIVIR